MLLKIAILLFVANLASVYIGMWAGWVVLIGVPLYKFAGHLSWRVRNAKNTVQVGTVLWRSNDDLHDDDSKKLYDQHFM